MFLLLPTPTYLLVPMSDPEYLMPGISHCICSCISPSHALDSPLYGSLCPPLPASWSRPCVVTWIRLCTVACAPSPRFLEPPLRRDLTWRRAPRSCRGSRFVGRGCSADTTDAANSWRRLTREGPTWRPPAPARRGQTHHLGERIVTILV